MKNMLLLALIIAIPSFAFLRQESNKGMAQVEKIDGKEIYLFSAPVHPYKVMEDYTNSKIVISGCNIENIVDSYLKRGKKDKVNFDALLMDGSKDIQLIKFIQPIPEE